MTQGAIGHVCAFAQLAFPLLTNFAALDNDTVMANHSMLVKHAL